MVPNHFYISLKAMFYTIKKAWKAGLTFKIPGFIILHEFIKQSPIGILQNINCFLCFPIQHNFGKTFKPPFQKVIRKNRTCKVQMIIKNQMRIANKIQLQKYTMRLGKKKPRNEPCRSPSPDIVSHSIIKNTTIQVQDIKSKMKKAEEKQIKFQLQSSYSLIGGPSELNSSFQGKYKQLFQEYTRMKLENKQLSEQNKILNTQNKRLSQHQDRQRTFSQLTGALLSRNENEPVLKERVSNLEFDKGNLERQLSLQKQRNEINLRSIESLRFQQQFLKDQLNRIASAPDGRPLESSLSFRDQQLRLTIFANSLFGAFETSLRNRLTQLNNRINKIEVQQRVIKQTHSRLIADSRINKTPSSFKSSRKVAPSTGKVEQKSKQLAVSNYRSDRQAYALSSSPRMKAQDSFENIQLQNFNLAEQFRAKNYEISRLKQEKERLAFNLYESQRDKNSSSTPKFKEGDQNLFKKLSCLETTVKSLQEENQTLHFENQRLNKLDSQKTSQKKQLLNLMQHQKKMISAYEQKLNDPKQCLFCIRKEHEIQQLKRNITNISENNKKDLYELQSQIKMQREEYDTRFKQNENQSNQLYGELELKYQKVIKLNEQLFQQLGNVKKMLQYIKQKFQISEVSALLDQNFQFFNQLQTTFYSEREQYDNYLLSMRASLLAKQQQIASLQTKLNLKTKEVELLQIQLAKLKQINREFHSHSMDVMKSNLTFMNRDSVQSKSKKFRQNNAGVLGKVRQGNQQISLLYQKVTNSIKIDYSKQFE